MSNIQVFNNEEFGKVRVVGDSDNPLFNLEDVGFALGYTRANNQGRLYLRKERIKKVLENSSISTSVHDGHEYIDEDGLYDFILESRTDNSRKFRKWVTSEVLPSIRKHGAYMTETVLEQAISNPDFAIGLLQSLKQTNEENKKLREDVKHKTNVIEGLVDDIDLATKRQRLQQIMRYDFQSPKQMSDRWNLLYSEFEKKYHVNLNSRLKSEKTLEIKPKIKNKLDYIDRVLDGIPEIYELACKIFHGNVESLKEEWFSIVQK